MCIASGESKPAQPLKLWVGKYCGHEHLAVTLAPVLWQDKNVHEVSECGVIGDDASKCDLFLADKAAKTERVGNGPLNHSERNRLGPVGLSGEEAVDEPEIQLCCFCRYPKFFRSALTPELSRAAKRLRLE